MIAFAKSVRTALAAALMVAAVSPVWAQDQAPSDAGATSAAAPTAQADWHRFDAEVERSVKAYDAGDYPQAKAILLPLAEAGHPWAMNTIGLMHDGTNVFPDDPKLECDWYERAARLKYNSAMYNLGLCYYSGDGRHKNIDTALLWFTEAAKHNSVGAQATLALHYVNIDREQYLYWAQKAATNGSVATKALMWGNGDKDLVPDLSWTDLVCVVVMIGWIGMGGDYCD